MTDQKKIQLLTKKSEMLKVIAHPMRLCILNCLMTTKDCNVTTLTKRMETPQSTISQHLSKLKSHNIIEGHRNGVEIQYNVIDEEVIELMHLLLKDLQNDVKEKTLNC